MYLLSWIGIADSPMVGCGFHIIYLFNIIIFIYLLRVLYIKQKISERADLAREDPLIAAVTLCLHGKLLYL